MVIRTLGATEHERILDLWQRAGLGALRPRGRDSLSALQEQYQAGMQTILGLEEDGELVGVVVATHDGRKGWINRLAVLPHARRCGFGGRLLAAAEDVLRRQGMTVIAALVEEENEASRSLFRNAGYREDRGIVYLSRRDNDDA